MAIAYDTASTDASGALSWSHTCTGTDLVLLVGVQTRSTTIYAVTGITYNGVALTKIDHQDGANNVRSELWYLIAPATGANTVEVTFENTPTRASAGAISLTGADQTAPIEASNKATGDTSNPTAAVVTVTDNAWAVASVMNRDASALTAGAGTERYDVSAGTSHRGWGATSGPKTPAGSVTITADNPTGPDDWAMVIAAVKPAGGALATRRYSLTTLGVG